VSLLHDLCKVNIYKNCKEVRYVRSETEVL
jgi:hypothetical protein